MIGQDAAEVNWQLGISEPLEYGDAFPGPPAYRRDGCAMSDFDGLYLEASVMNADERSARVREIRGRPVRAGPVWTRGAERDFETVTLPERDCDLLRDLLISERARTVVEIGLGYGSSALAIGEALVTIGAAQPRHIVIDPFQQQAFANVGWDVLCSAGLDSITTLMAASSSIALPKLVTDGVVADAAFVDGSHRFHEVFVDLYFLRKIVRPGGVIVLDDDWTPSVRTAVRYYERNLGWRVLPDAFADGTFGRIGGDPAAAAVSGLEGRLGLFAAAVDADVAAGPAQPVGRSGGRGCHDASSVLYRWVPPRRGDSYRWAAECTPLASGKRPLSILSLGNI
jgi:predicted O-methyltransferase YrrM